MRKSIEVVDGFYRDPSARREQALASARTEPGAAADVGAGTEELFPDSEATARLAALLGRDRAAPLPALAGRAVLVGAGGDRRSTPHVHDEQWAAVVCLTPPEDGFSRGVEFYRPESGGPSGAWGSSGVHEVHHPDLWEETMYVPLIFNRMVLFRGAIPHRCASRGSGRSPADDRLVRLFLFDEPAGGR